MKRRIVNRIAWAMIAILTALILGGAGSIGWARFERQQTAKLMGTPLISGYGIEDVTFENAVEKLEAEIRASDPRLRDFKITFSPLLDWAAMYPGVPVPEGWKDPRKNKTTIFFNKKPAPAGEICSYLCKLNGVKYAINTGEITIGPIRADLRKRGYLEAQWDRIYSSIRNEVIWISARHSPDPSRYYRAR